MTKKCKNLRNIKIIYWKTTMNIYAKSKNN